MIERARQTPQPPPSSRELRRRRARRLALRFLLGCGIPTVVAIVYYGFFVTPRYESVAVVSVEDKEGPLRWVNEKHGSKDATLVVEMVRARWPKDVRATRHGHSNVVRLTARAPSAQEAQVLAREVVAAIQAKVDEASAKAEQGHVYLVVAAEPSLPDAPAYPKRLWGVATVLFTSLALVAVLSLLAAAVREHAQF